MKLEAYHVEQVAQQSPQWRMLLDYTDHIDTLPFRVALTMVIFVSIFYGSEQDPYSEYSTIVCKIIVALLAFLLLFATVLNGVFWFVVTAPTELFPKYNIELNDHYNRRKVQAVASAVNKKGELLLQEPADIHQTVLHNCLTCWRAYACVINILLALVLVLNCVTSTPGDILGYDLTFIVGFLLIEYIRLPVGSSVFASIRYGAPGLLDSLKVAAVVILVYSTAVSYLTFHDDVVDTSTNTCVTAYQCLFQSFNDGIRGDLNTLQNFRFTSLKLEDDSESQLQWWVLTVFFIFWLFIMRGIVQGQIVDAFDALRRESDNRAADLAQFCLVCSADRYELEQIQPGAFEHHVHNEHNPISYLYYMMHIDENVSNPMRNGMVSYVHSEVSADSFIWLPVGASELTKDVNSGVNE